MLSMREKTMWKKILFYCLSFGIVATSAGVAVDNTFFDSLFPRTPYVQVCQLAAALLHEIQEKKISVDDVYVAEKLALLYALLKDAQEYIDTKVSKKHAAKLIFLLKKFKSIT